MIETQNLHTTWWCDRRIGTKKSFSNVSRRPSLQILRLSTILIYTTYLFCSYPLPSLPFFFGIALGVSMAFSCRILLIGSTILVTSIFLHVHFWTSLEEILTSQSWKMEHYTLGPDHTLDDFFVKKGSTTDYSNWLLIIVNNRCF